MHCLEVIIDRNSRAAGRAGAHAFLDGDRDLARAIRDAEDHEAAPPHPFIEAWIEALKVEGK